MSLAEVQRSIGQQIFPITASSRWFQWTISTWSGRFTAAAVIGGIVCLFYCILKRNDSSSQTIDKTTKTDKPVSKTELAQPIRGIIHLDMEYFRRYHTTNPIKKLTVRINTDRTILVQHFDLRVGRNQEWICLPLIPPHQALTLNFSSIRDDDRKLDLQEISVNISTENFIASLNNQGNIGVEPLGPKLGFRVDRSNYTLGTVTGDGSKRLFVPTQVILKKGNEAEVKNDILVEPENFFQTVNQSDYIRVLILRLQSQQDDISNDARILSIRFLVLPNEVKRFSKDQLTQAWKEAYALRLDPSAASDFLDDTKLFQKDLELCFVSFEQECYEVPASLL